MASSFVYLKNKKMKWWNIKDVVVQKVQEVRGVPTLFIPIYGMTEGLPEEGTFNKGMSLHRA